jgi:hypothetical protein
LTQAVMKGASRRLPRSRRKNSDLPRLVEQDRAVSLCD